ncbi:S8 family serine peptidase [Bacillus massiliigorillae]|uniref:S8 family serine peptidase n=1 Tax=Bacillus massiliigorillae TaxID=1243664 RepID=UPI00039B12DA|nr:S8 family serine peptidase [Bacillus massiliigorillae]
MKKNIFLLLLLSFFIAAFSSSAEADVKREEESINKNIIAIVTSEDKASLNVKLQFARHYPGITIRKIFRYALYGFSIEGKRKDITAFKRAIGEGYLHEAVSYTMTINESVPFIGGRAIQGLYDNRNQRVTGKGVKIGVIDTGIDYTHPDLKRVYKGGRDLVDGDDDPMETLSPSFFATLHGTHVAGIISANGKMQGVAPGAEIYAYRALGPGGSGTSEGIIAAIEAAISDRMDIINLSLGNTINGPDLPITLALNKAVDLGITAVVSSGNSGPSPWTVGSPGTSTKAISVGASYPPVKQSTLQVGLGVNRLRIPLQQIYGAKEWSYYSSKQMIDGGYGKKEELNNANGYVVLLKRGKISLQKKIKNAEDKGAVGVIIYNDIDGGFIGSVTKNVNVPAVTIEKKEGLQLKKLLKINPRMLVQTVLLKEQDHLASFSSRGPVTVSWEIKPDVVAPGVAIDSTVPGGYIALQGTSMAAPHVAGAAALLKQAHPEWKPDQIKSALMSTAKLLTKPDGTYYKTYEQGAGRIQIDQAVQADTFFYPNSLTFGLFNRYRGEHQHVKELVIENKSKYSKHYSFIIPKDDVGLLWKVPFSFTLKSNEKRKVYISLSVNGSKLKKGVYEGYFLVKEGTKSLHIPYIYLNEEPEYPRIMGFYFSSGDLPDTYRYEMYVPDGGDELTIALYDYDTYRYVGLLDQANPLPKGLIQKSFKRTELPPAGLYHAILVVKKGNKSEEYHKMIEIN